MDWDNSTLPLPCFDGTVKAIKLTSRENYDGDFAYFTAPSVSGELIPYTESTNPVDFGSLPAVAVSTHCVGASSGPHSVLVFVDDPQGARFVGYPVTIDDDIIVEEVAFEEGHVVVIGSGYSPEAPRSDPDMDVVGYWRLSEGNDSLDRVDYTVTRKPEFTAGSGADDAAAREFACANLDNAARVQRQIKANIAALKTGEIAGYAQYSEAALIGNISEIHALQRRLTDLTRQMGTWAQICGRPARAY